MRKTPRFVLTGAMIFVLLSGCMKNEAAPKERDLLRMKSQTHQDTKKVILICVDTLMSQSIDKGIKQKKLPTFQFLTEHGQYYKNVVTSFPTMSVSIDSTFLTGTYPNDHQVPGLVWYSSKEKKVINYGTNVPEISRHGLNRYFGDVLQLNGSHLNPDIPTIFEDLTHKGLKSGSVNGLIYRGSSDHLLSFPLWMRVPSALPKEIKVKGPDFFAFGAFSNPLEGKKNLPDNINDRFGFNNHYSVEVVKYLIQNNKIPDFLYVYFPDLDSKLHKKGPSDLDGVIQTDQQLESMLHAFGSREKALKKAVILIMGDNGMTHVQPANQQPVIDLSQSFKKYDVLLPGAAAVRNQTEIVLAVNDRMAYVYKLKPQLSFEQIATDLKADTRVDILAWKDKGWIQVRRGGSAKPFAYRSKGSVVDPYKQSWTLAKDPEVLDLQINNQKHTLDYGQYPDVLQRLFAAFHSHNGEFMVITAKPGYEFKYGSSPTHKGGAGHGGISKTESLVPLIISGTDRKPESLRIVDLKPYLLKVITNG